MVKKFVCSILFVISSCIFAEKGQVDLVSPTRVDIRSGASSWSTKLVQPIQVNPIQILFWNTSRCNYIPITSLSVKYVNDVYWYNAVPKDGYYEVESKYFIEAVKLDFYLDAPDEFCVLKVVGFRDIAS